MFLPFRMSVEESMLRRPVCAEELGECGYATAPPRRFHPIVFVTGHIKTMFPLVGPYYSHDVGKKQYPF